MRKIEIASQAGETHPFVAIDQESGQVMFRHDDLEQLRTMCRKLGWDIVRDTATPLRAARDVPHGA